MSLLTDWYLAAGALLVLMALLGAAIARLPFSAAILYLAFGYALGRGGLGLLDVDLTDHLPLVESIAEIGVVLALFSVGLRLGVPLDDPGWKVPLRLAGPGMALTIAAAAAAGWWLLDLGWASALLLGAVVAPTDPVLASDVQVRRVSERDAVRFGLTAEGGMNDGLAAAGILLALALHAGPAAVGRSILADLAWALPAGLAIGWACGSGIGSLALALHRRDGTPEGFEVFLLLGLIALAYGLATAAHAEGFLAVFAAAVALRRGERRATARSRARPAAEPGAPAAIAHQLLRFNRQIEHIAEVVVVVLAGALLATVTLDLRVAAFAAVVLLAARPLAVALALAGAGVPARERRLLQWFGVRGIGSLYWLAFALNRGAPGADAAVLTAATLGLIAASIVAHGVSATPAMDWHLRRRRSA